MLEIDRIAKMLRWPSHRMAELAIVIQVTIDMSQNVDSQKRNRLTMSRKIGFIGLGVLGFGNSCLI